MYQPIEEDIDDVRIFVEDSPKEVPVSKFLGMLKVVGHPKESRCLGTLLDSPTTIFHLRETPNDLASRLDCPSKLDPSIRVTRFVGRLGSVQFALGSRASLDHVSVKPSRQSSEAEAKHRLYWVLRTY